MPRQYQHQLPSRSYLLSRLFLEKMVLAEVRLFYYIVLVVATQHFRFNMLLKSFLYPQFVNIVNIGAQKLARICENSNFFRSELKKMGFEVLGDNDSPVMPIMLYNPSKIPAFSRECLKRKVSVSLFSFPIISFSYVVSFHLTSTFLSIHEKSGCCGDGCFPGHSIIVGSCSDLHFCFSFKRRSY